MKNMKPILKHGGRCRTQNAGFLRSFSVVLFLLPLLFAHTAYGDINSDLLEAAKAGSTAKVEQLLSKGANVNAKDEDGSTALIAAAREGHTKTLKVLIEAGANVKTKDNGGITALMIAAVFGHTETVKALINAGADAYAEDKEGRTALTWVARMVDRAEIIDLLKQAGAVVKHEPPKKFDSELNTPGVVFELEEVGRQRKGGSTAVDYTLKASGFPADKEYALWVIESGTNKAARICPVEVNDAGDVECQFGGQKIALRNMRMGINSYVKGEPVRYLLVSADQTVYAFVKKVPFPIEDQDGSCRISVDRSTQKGGRALLSGFPAGEHVEIMAKVGKQTSEEAFTAEESTRRDGLQKAIDLVPSRGKGGKATVDVKAPSCSLSVTYKWGSKAKYQ